MARCAKTIVNTMFFVRFQFLCYLLFWGAEGCSWRPFWDPFGHLGDHFGGSGGSWKQVGISMDFGILLGTTPGSDDRGGGRLKIACVSSIWQGLLLALRNSRVSCFVIFRNPVGCLAFTFQLQVRALPTSAWLGRTFREAPAPDYER